MPTPTPHNVDAYSYPRSQTSWRVSQPLSLHHQTVSAAVTQRPYHVAHRQPGHCLQVYCSLTWLLRQLFIFFPPWYVYGSRLLLFAPLAPVANTLSSQSGDNDCHLDLCLIKSFPLGSNSTPLFRPQNGSLVTSPEKVLSTVSQVRPEGVCLSTARASHRIRDRTKTSITSVGPTIWWMNGLLAETTKKVAVYSPHGDVNVFFFFYTV